MCWWLRFKGGLTSVGFHLSGKRSMKDLGGKTAFVTGAASGIGLGIATALAQAGVKVMLCDIEETALAKAVEGMKQTNADVDGVKADVSLKAELKAAAEAIDRPLWQSAHSRQQRRSGRRRPVRRLDRRWMGVDARRQSDGRRVGNRDFRPSDRTAWRGRTHCVHCVDRRADLGRRHSIQRIQIRCRRSIRGVAQRTRSSWDRRVGAVSGIRPYPDHGLLAKPAGTFRPHPHGQIGGNSSV